MIFFLEYFEASIVLVTIYRSLLCILSFIHFFYFRIPNKVLKPEDFPENRSYRPQTGFSPRSHNPYHISPGGMRMVGCVALTLKLL